MLESSWKLSYEHAKSFLKAKSFECEVIRYFLNWIKKVLEQPLNTFHTDFGTCMQSENQAFPFKSVSLVCVPQKNGEWSNSGNKTRRLKSALFGCGTFSSAQKRDFDEIGNLKEKFAEIMPIFLIFTIESSEFRNGESINILCENAFNQIFEMRTWK